MPAGLRRILNGTFTLDSPPSDGRPAGGCAADQAARGRDGFLEYEFAARLALGEGELASGRTAAGRARLETLQTDATAEGFLLVARQSADALALKLASRPGTRP